MASYQLGPETPRPFSVLSEGHLGREMTLPSYCEKDRFTFGPSYERSLCEMVHKYLDLGTDDELCYIGENKGSIVDLLVDKFCLLKPVVAVQPGVIHYAESEGHHMVPIQMPHVGAQEYFEGEVTRGQFDKVLMNDCLQFINDQKKFYLNVMRSMKTFGKLLIILRPPSMNTLPLFDNAKTRLEDVSQDYMRVINDLQSLYFDVSWEIEVLPVVMSKVKWFTMMRDKFPPSLEVLSGHEVQLGIRELSEGVLKYGGDLIEFKDRLLFVTATHGSFDDYPSVQRHSVKVPRSYPGIENLCYSMEVTPDLRPYVNVPPKQSNRPGKKPSPGGQPKAAVTILP